MRRPAPQTSHEDRLIEIKHFLQRYSVPLLVGILLALIWANVSPQNYAEVWDPHHSTIELGVLWGHNVTPAFLINDIFMVLFFGLATKEVAEALLPGGSLSPLKKALCPLISTCGGVVGPAVCYAIVIVTFQGVGAFDDVSCAEAQSHDDDGHRRALAARAPLGGEALGRFVAGVARRTLLSGDEAYSSSYSSSYSAYSSYGDAHGDDYDDECSTGLLLHGWGVPTATDISLAWMVAIVVFGIGHPAIDFMLLLAIVDDAIGLVIIAVVYPNPAHPFDPIQLIWLGLGMLLAWAFRAGLPDHLQKWQVGRVGASVVVSDRARGSQSAGGEVESLP